MDKLLLFLETYKGRDKILRLLCYFSKFLAGSVKSHDFASQLEKFSSQLSTSRACFRLLDDIPTISYIASGLNKNEDASTIIEQAVRILESIVDVIFCPLDHISWALSNGIIKSENSLWDTASTLCWVVSLYISIYKSLVKLANISSRKISLESFPTKRNELRKLNAQQWNLQLSILKYLFDITFAINYLPEGVLWAKFFTKKGVGALGTVSSLLSLYQALLL